jgi:hypothetical protein
MYYETLYDFCLTSSVDNTQIHFNPNGEDFNGYNSWISDDTNYSIYWNTSLNKWQVTGGELPYLMFSSSSYPPLNSWYILGAIGEITSNEGVCNVINTTSFRTSVNHPTCACDGSLTILITNGYPPFQYSINGGVTYQSSSIFPSLCSGTYFVKVIDSLQNIYTDSIILNKATPPTVYTLKLNTSSKTSVNTSTNLTKNYITTVNVTPTLPDGVSLTFNLSHNNNFYSSPTSGTSSQVVNSILYIDGTPQSITSSDTSSNSLSFSTVAGCQSNQLFYTGISEYWESIVITNTTIIELQTTSIINKSLPMTICSVGKSDETYSINNASINGCGCCTVRIVSEQQN